MTANNLLGSGHPPSKLVWVPLDGLRRLDRLALILNGRNFGNVEVLQAFLNSERMAEKGIVSSYCLSRLPGDSKSAD
jgi:hypothetical protein